MMTLSNYNEALPLSFSSKFTTVRSCTSTAFLLMLFLLMSMILSNYATTSYYSTSDNEISSDFLNDYSDSIARILLARKRISPPRRRSCIRRGSSCDHRPTDCCVNSSCRCNLWGTNCRCSRMGLFERWG